MEELGAVTATMQRITPTIVAAMHPSAELKSLRKTTSEWVEQVTVELGDMLIKVQESQKAFAPPAPAKPAASRKPASNGKAANGGRPPGTARPRRNGKKAAPAAKPPPRAAARRPPPSRSPDGARDFGPAPLRGGGGGVAYSCAPSPPETSCARRHTVKDLSPHRRATLVLSLVTAIALVAVMIPAAAHAAALRT